MSSILRALKKLENEPRHLEENQGLDSKFVPLAETRPPRKSTGVLMVVLGGGLVCGLVILAGWWLLAEKKLPAPAPPRQGARQELPQPAPGSDPGTDEARGPEAAVAAGPDITPETPRPADDIAVSPAIPEPAPAPTPVRLPQPAGPIIAQSTVRPMPVQAAIPSSLTPEEEEVEAPEPAPGAGVITETDTGPGRIAAPEAEKIEIPLLDDPQMKLQAVTWSMDPQKRIAVINNNILRQGETVAGYRLDAINQDDVVLNRGGQKWKLLFRIR